MTVIDLDKTRQDLEAKYRELANKQDTWDEYFRETFIRVNVETRMKPLIKSEELRIRDEELERRRLEYEEAERLVDYEELIKCRECGLLLGYAPYMREEYRCIECEKSRR